jgi:hypothetical protein
MQQLNILNYVRMNVIQSIHAFSISKPISVAVQSKAWVYGRSLAGTVISNAPGDMDVCLL